MTLDLEGLRKSRSEEKPELLPESLTGHRPGVGMSAAGRKADHARRRMDPVSIAAERTRLEEINKLAGVYKGSDHVVQECRDDLVCTAPEAARRILAATGTAARVLEAQGRFAP